MEDLHGKIEEFKQIINPKNNKCPIDGCGILSVKGYCHIHRTCIDEIIKNKWSQIFEIINSPDNEFTTDLALKLLSDLKNKKNNTFASTNKLSMYEHHLKIASKISDKYDNNLLLHYTKFKDDIKNYVNIKYGYMDSVMFCISKYDRQNYEFLMQNKDAIKGYLIKYYSSIKKIDFSTEKINYSEIIINLKNIYCNFYNDIANHKQNTKFRDIFANIIQNNKNILTQKYIDPEKYNGKLYKEIKKIEDKFDNIFLVEREKKFYGLSGKSNLRYDIFGALLNKKTSQINYFIIEHDDNSHFNNKKQKEYDIIKDIYALYNAYSLLRIHYNDDIYDCIFKFIEKIIYDEKPIYIYA